jgi:hypothetical protein
LLAGQRLLFCNLSRTHGLWLTSFLLRQLWWYSSMHGGFIINVRLILSDKQRR